VHTEPDRTWLGVGEAAPAAGVSLSAIRKWIASGEVPTRTGTGPRGDRVEVPLDAVTDRAKRAAPAGGPGAALVLADAFTRLEALAAQLVDYGERAARAEVRAEMLDRQLDEARAEVRRLTDALDDARAAPTTPTTGTVRPQRWWRR